LNGGANKNVVAQEFDRWKFAGGKVLDGLVKRRNAEKQLFLS
jgi:GH24 family phage-related lysozyme (muramidase)